MLYNHIKIPHTAQAIYRLLNDVIWAIMLKQNSPLPRIMEQILVKIYILDLIFFDIAE